jgi:colicin import membrane protein
VRETRADTAQALSFALLLHLLLFGLAFLGLRWSHETTSAAGAPVQADLIDPNALSAAMRRSLATPTRPVPAPETPPVPQPMPVPRPEQAPVPQQKQAQERIPVPDQVDQERVDRDALSAETAAREQEAKHRQEQIDLTEQKRQDEAQNKIRQMEQQRLQQLADIRKQRQQAAKDAALAEQKLQQLADARSRNAAVAAAQSDAAASAPAGNNGTDNDLRSRYAAALTDAILHNWVRPDSVPNGVKCRIVIRQVVGGSVIDVQVAPSCPFDELGKRSVEAAVLKAQPLPYAGFEPVFSRTLELDFIPHD